MTIRSQPTRPAAIAEAVAEQLASPTQIGPREDPPWWPQSLASGALAIALLHIQRALAELGPWQRAHDWLAYTSRQPIATGPDAHLHYGAPALAFVLHLAAEHHPARYSHALTALDHRIRTDTQRRLDQAHTRIDHAQPATMIEFDAIRGLTGLGAYWLRRDPHSDILRAILTYLVRLTEPIPHPDRVLPGWWTPFAPSGRRTDDFPHGHINHGMAHGISGPLALLSLACRHGVRVPGHHDAITRICAWLDRWRQDTPPGPRWPYWITPTKPHTNPDTKSDTGLDTDMTAVPAIGRPSWCYGTAGVARAQQLAAIALGDIRRQHMAETALALATGPDQRAMLRDASVCHGLAGLLHIITRAHKDADPQATTASALTNRRRALHAALLDDPAIIDLTRPGPPGRDLGLLEGAPGIALALHSAADPPPGTGWDTCLLTN